MLHRVLREHLETFLGRRSEAGEPMPSFVVDELRGYLRCGVLAHGAVRFACEHCGTDRWGSRAKAEASARAASVEG